MSGKSDHEKENFDKMKVYNKTVKDWVRGQLHKGSSVINEPVKWIKLN